jgi:hypothetical protein
MKQKKTPLADLRGVVSPVKGWNDPHVFVRGERHVLTKNDAREMAHLFAKEIFRRRFGINLVQTDMMPKRRGEYRITLQTGDFSSGEQRFRVRFHDGEYLLTFEIKFPNSSGGVSTREVLSLIEDSLSSGDRDMPDGWEESVFGWEWKSAEEIEEETRQRTEKRKEAILNEQAMARLRTAFPQWFQKTYKQSVRWSSLGSPQMSYAALHCPLNSRI